MGKKNSERRVYTKEFKAEAVALAKKRETPISQVAVDLGRRNERVLRWWMQETRAMRGSSIAAFPGRRRPRDEERARLRKEGKSLRQAHEILKKAAILVAQGEP